jgi:hypothetical protein
MKTEATHATEPSAPSHPSDGSRGEAGVASFPEVLAQRGAGANEGCAVAEGEGGAVDPVDGFVTLAATLATQAVVASHAMATRHDDLDASSTPRRPRVDLLDAAARQVAQLAPPLATPQLEVTPVHGDAPLEARARASLEDMLPAIVRRIAWAGDGRNGSLRLEFGAGALAGGTLVVHADDGRVRVELRAPSGTDASAWRDRIATRLEEKNIGVDEIVVE